MDRAVCRERELFFRSLPEASRVQFDFGILLRVPCTDSPYLSLALISREFAASVWQFTVEIHATNKRNMRNLLAAFVAGLILLTALFPAARAQTPAFPPPASEFQIPGNETLTYAVDWRVFPAGTATFHLQSEGANIHVTATAASIGTV